MATVSFVRPAFFDSTVTEEAPDAIAAPQTTTVSAASSVSESPREWVLGLAYGALLAAAAVAFALQDDLKAPLTVALGAGAFALFYVAAQAEERLLEPFTHFILSTKSTKDEADTAKKSAVTSENADTALAAAQTAADKAAELKRMTSERTILFWALASIIGIALSIWLGLYFFAAVLSAEAAGTVPRWLDVIATGLVIGGGSKALHDLVGKTQKPSTESSTA